MGGNQRRTNRGMFNYKLEIEYDGTSYCGWQKQSNSRRSIQETIEKALQRIFQEKVHLIASGRTDAGVHAKAQVANFKSAKCVSSGKIHNALNGLLPEDIRISKVKIASPDFHSRFEAKSKIYRYTILNRPYSSALSRNTVYFYPYPLDTRLMLKEAKVILGKHNFKSFAASDKKERNPVKTIKKVNVKRDDEFIYIDIEADGFLYNMVRNIAGTLIDIGRGRMKTGSIKKILLLRNRIFAGPTAPAKGLCLLKVKYKK